MKNINIIIISFIVLVFPACDVLDQEPISIISDKNFFQNGEQAEAAISSAYQPLREGSLGRDFFASATAGADDSNTDPSSGGNNNRMNGHAVNADHGPARDLWRTAYLIIHRANDVIEKLPGVEDPALEINNKRENLLGEAYFLRGYLHFMLLRWYGEVPILLSTTKSSDPEEVKVERDPLPQVYEQVISDLTFAAENLPMSYDNNVFTRGRATKGAAQGILAKVYLRRAYTSFAGANDFTEAANWAKMVMDNTSLYQLLPAEEYASIWAADGGNTIESIWEFQTEEVGLNEGDNLHREFEARENGGNARARILPSQKIIDAFNENPSDIRFSAAIGAMDPGINNGFSFYYKKYNRNGGQLVPNQVALRLPDIMLVRAEALNASGNTPGAIQILDEIRIRAQIPNTTASTQEEVFQAIQDERFLELCAEGRRWYDLTRFPANNYEWARNEYAETAQVSQMDENETYQLRWPINNRELDVNENLVQNPGYGGSE